MGRFVVRRVFLPARATESFTVIGPDLRPVELVDEYLAWLTDCERSPNTSRGTRTTCARSGRSSRSAGWASRCSNATVLVLVADLQGVQQQPAHGVRDLGLPGHGVGDQFTGPTAGNDLRFCRPTEANSAYDATRLLTTN